MIDLGPSNVDMYDPFGKVGGGFKGRAIESKVAERLALVFCLQLRILCAPSSIC